MVQALETSNRYLAVGLLSGLRAGFLAGVIAATIAGLLDSTLGPLSAWMAGSGPVGQTITDEGVIAYGISVVTGTAAAAGAIGALAGVWVERRRGLRARSRAVPSSERLQKPSVASLLHGP